MKKNYSLAVLCLLMVTVITLTSGISKSDKGGYGDIVERLYSQEVKRNGTLKNIEESIDAFYRKKEASLEKFNGFSYQNNEYYKDANARANIITDAAAKQKALDIIRKSEEAYRANVASWQGLITTLNNNERQLKDLHQLLKITVTIPVIEAYQKTELPSTTDATTTNNELLKIIEAIKTITK
jgi:hypothetical protein